MAEIPVNSGMEGYPEPKPEASAAPQQPAVPSFQPVVPPTQSFGSPQPPATSAKSGSGAMKIIFIILGVFAFMVLLVVCVLAYACHRVKQAIQVDSKSGSMSIPGVMTADSGMKFTARELGTDIYPGAEPKKTGNLRMNIAGSSVVSAAFLTPDPVEKVVAFYKDKLGSNATSMEFGGTAILTAKKSDHDQVSVTIAQQTNQDDGKTKIQIQHTTSAQAN